MSCLFIFTLNNTIQTDLFYSNKDGYLDLEKLSIIMKKRAMPISNGRVKGEGFSDVKITSNNLGQFIDCLTTTQNSLGYYYEAELRENGLESNKVHHSYFSKSSIILTYDNYLIVRFEWTAEEVAKSKVKSLIEGLGFKVNPLKVTEQSLRKIQREFTWTAIKLDRIEKDGDKTKRVSYEIDPTDDSVSLVDQEYREHGKMSHISFECPIGFEDKNPRTRNLITVKLYTDGGNRIFIDDKEFGHHNDIINFQIVLLRTLVNHTPSESEVE